MADDPKTAVAAIRLAIDNAEKAAPSAVETGRGDAQSVKIAGAVLEMRHDGLFRVPGEGFPLRVCGPFEVLSQTREEDAWGLLLKFRDPDGAQQVMVARRDLFAGDGAELKNALALRGLFVNPAAPARGLLAEYLSRVGTEKRARIVGLTGWHRIDGVPIFVLGDRTFGTPPVEVIYQPAMRDSVVFDHAGTVDMWRELVARPCLGNSRLTLAVSAAFAGPLLDIVNEEGGGLHFRGSSRIGKTTALRVAASVWGGEVGSGAAGFIRQWRATGNAVEGLAASHSDALLCLDELGQADPREVGDTAYLLAAGQGKARSDRAGRLRPLIRFRVLFLSTGELSLGDKIAEAGRQVKAGQEVRLVDIPADAGGGFGMFEELHDAPDAEAFIQLLRDGTNRAFGVAAPAFLEYLVARVAGEPGLGDDLRDWLHSIVSDWMATHPDAGGQVRSVARRFALVAIAGELATEAGITGWEKTDASTAAHTCFAAWLAERGTPGAREDVQAVTQLRDFITSHGDARFHEWKDPAPGDAGQSDTPPAPPREQFRTVNRVGWKRRQTEENGSEAWHFYLTAAGMKEALTGLDRRQAHKILTGRGYLAAGSAGRNSNVFNPPGHPHTRLYHVLPAILAAADGDF